MALSIKGAGSLLARIPTALFPISLGLAGLGAVSRTAAISLSAPWLLTAGAILMVVAAITLVLDVALYLIKLVRHRNEVIEDIAMATRANLLAPGLMAAMVVGAALADYSNAGVWVWAVASGLHVALLLGFVGRWLTHDYAPSDLNPTWFLPAAGIMTSAMTWPGSGPVEFPLITLGAGIVLWLMLLPLVFRRLVFEPAVAPELRPTLFIVAAPFGLAAGALLTLFPDIGERGPILILNAGAFLLAALVLQVRFISQAGITLSWWATTFPVATVSMGFFRVSEQAGTVALASGTLLLGLAYLTTAVALVATVRAAWCTCAKTVNRTEAQIEAMQGRG